MSRIEVCTEKSGQRTERGFKLDNRIDLVHPPIARANVGAAHRKAVDQECASTIITDVDFLTPVRMMATEFGWTEIFDSGPRIARTLVFAKANFKLNIYFDQTGVITRSVRYRFKHGIDVAHVYLSSLLPTDGQATDTLFIAQNTGPAAVLALTLHVMGGWGR